MSSLIYSAGSSKGLAAVDRGLWLVVVTNNTREFERVAGLQLED